MSVLVLDIVSAKHSYVAIDYTSRLDCTNAFSNENPSFEAFSPFMHTKTLETLMTMRFLKTVSK